MGEISGRVRAVRDRLAKRRSERRAASGERALKRKEVAATRLRHERLDEDGMLALSSTARLWRRYRTDYMA